MKYSGYLGKRVRVKLDEKVIVEGQLLSYGDCGECVIRDAYDGDCHYCWPMLEIEEVNEQDAG